MHVRLAACLLVVACHEPAATPACAGPVAVGPTTGPANVPSVPRPQSFDVPAIDAYVTAQLERRGLVGLSLAIVRDGELVHTRGYGKASLRTGAPVDAETAFAIGSVTKQFTCASALLLAEDGKLALTDTVAEHRPELARAADITLYDLLSNVSGYPDYYPLDFVDERMQRPIDPDALLRQYAGGPLDFEPGTRWSYSNTGFVLAGRIVESVAAEPLAAFMQRRLFAPAGMRRSSFEPTAETIAADNMAIGHTRFALGELTPTAPEARGWMHAAGAIYSSAADLARWDLALIDGKLLRPESLQQMLRPRILKSGEPTDYGCGVAISRRQGETVISHNGAVSGFLAYNAMIPRTRSAVVVLSNAEQVDAGGLHNELLSLLIEADRPRPTIAGPPPIEVARALLKEMQTGQIDRSRLSGPFSKYLDEERVRAAAPRLTELGEPTSVALERLSERGGMEVATLRLGFARSNARALLYRSSDGKVHEFLLMPE